MKYLRRSTRHTSLMITIAMIVIACEDTDVRTQDTMNANMTNMTLEDADSSDILEDEMMPLDSTMRSDSNTNPSADSQGLDGGLLTPDAMIQIERSQCETALGGEPWDNMVAESQPGFEADLMAVSLESLPDEVDISRLIPLFRGLIAYTLDIPPDQLGDSLQKTALLNQGMLGRVVAASLVLGQNDPLGVDIVFLRRGLHRYYHCGRNFPLTLEGFRASIFDYNLGEPQNVESIAKCGTRRLIVNESAEVYIAETLVDGEVRETEILIKGNRRDGNLDFLIYNSSGRLSDRTRFPTTTVGTEVMAGSPYVCTTCHLNADRTADTVGYDTLFPDVGPCAP